MPDGLLTLLRIVFLALLYLFFFRVLRAVWVELREPKVVAIGAPIGPSTHGPPAPVPHPAPVTEATRATPGGPRLVVVEPPEHEGRTFPLPDEVTVGRAPGCGVPLPDDTFVSSIHARIFRRDGVLHVEDLGSTNGTFLNRRPVSTPAPLRKGDRLQVGRTLFEVTR